MVHVIGSSLAVALLKALTPAALLVALQGRDPCAAMPIKKRNLDIERFRGPDVQVQLSSSDSEASARVCSASCVDEPAIRPRFAFVQADPRARVSLDPFA